MADPTNPLSLDLKRIARGVEPLPVSELPPGTTDITTDMMSHLSPVVNCYPVTMQHLRQDRYPNHNSHHLQRQLILVDAPLGSAKIEHHV